ncbi:MAG: tetratricopeptide repeat protein [Spirochaetaceae bacterium]|nr:tetratricopeptide repeat protein [Spirochaetaceae bacterium]
MRLVLTVLALFPVFASCSAWPGFRGADIRKNYYIIGDQKQQESFRDLFALLDGGAGNAEERFSIVNKIAGEYARLKEYSRLINFLGGWLAKYPGDPYSAYYLLMTAYAYSRQDADEVAVLYYNLIVSNYPDLMVKGESVHFIALNRLITLTENQEQLVRYYEELLSRFSGKTDPGVAYFQLGQAYEKTGEWNLAIQAYTRFLPYYGTVIPGFPDAYAYAKRLVDFNNSPKDWTFESLPAMVGTIENALNTGNSRRLWSYRAKVNFFTRSWGQEDDDSAEMAEFTLVDFMRGNQIRYASELDESSNANEAYLRTWGWYQYISTWYFYFRKIYFPLDPEIHGRWEWAGIYYGEKW